MKTFDVFGFFPLPAETDVFTGIGREPLHLKRVQALRPLRVTASEPRGCNSTGFKGLNLNSKARIWPCLSCVCHTFTQQRRQSFLQALIDSHSTRKAPRPCDHSESDTKSHNQSKSNSRDRQPLRVRLIPTGSERQALHKVHISAL